ncbi:MAG: D-alanyl-D-alanine carboxypeptidase/D-alanyl-D-alanine-endopeptidase [Gammaproteobacteria bacterium]|nr:D-alanyl-D-alanine carboxypeptidase/D-alanyl-D-alanine-endopeptidase [Gammaproteobacteria bacterium]TVQ48599.1 MAG: D-alanyl-D-alanine carboxypeptidase/D-alanyl-D-alanine-endopeptidase [Gammaproteobacteria bacterium]
MRAAPTLIGSLLLGALCLAPTGVLAETGLPEPVARVAAALGVPAGDISLWVQELGAPEPLAMHLPEVSRNPASVMKLVTSFAALQGLNPAYRWHTEVHLLGALEDGVLDGDLLIRGGGDPFLVAEEYWKLVNGLRGRGLQRITGDLVFDVSYFDLPPEDPGSFDGRPDRIYNLVPHPLLVNFNAVRFEFQPGGDGRSVKVRTDPQLDTLQVRNRLRLGEGRCAGYQRGVSLTVLADPRDQVLLEGRFPSACNVYGLTRSVLLPESYAWELFKVYWRQLGGELEGGWRWGEVSERPALAAPEASLARTHGGNGSPANGLGDSRDAFHVHRSRPLGELVRLVNKYSNNVMTRHLELTLGAERFGAPATPEKGRTAILELLAIHGIGTEGMVLDNAAGLSRNVRLTARQVTELLQVAWEAPYMPEFVSSLALSGLDGTLRRRLDDAPSRGRMHLKTGTLNDVSAVAGYVQVPDGRRLSVVLLVNSPDAHRGPGEELQDALLNWVYSQ